MELEYQLENIEAAAVRLLSVIDGNAVIAFSGDMGAGKTTFIHALCRALGVTENMSSPTFSIINEYQSPSGPIYHIDLYRCRSAEEVIRAGVEDCLFSGNRCFVEWPSVAFGIFPPETLAAHINQIDNNTRKIVVSRKLYDQTIL